MLVLGLRNPIGGSNSVKHVEQNVFFCCVIQIHSLFDMGIRFAHGKHSAKIGAAIDLLVEICCHNAPAVEHDTFLLVCPFTAPSFFSFG